MDRNGEERNGSERKGSERTGADWNGEDCDLMASEQQMEDIYRFAGIYDSEKEDEEE